MGLPIFYPFSPPTLKMSTSESITCQELEATLFSGAQSATVPPPWQPLASSYCDAPCAEYDANTGECICFTCEPDEELPPRLNLQGGESQGEYDEGASPHIPVVAGPPRQPQPPTPLNLLPGYNTPQEADNGAATPMLFAPAEDDTPVLSPTLIPNQNLEELD